MLEILAQLKDVHWQPTTVIQMVGKLIYCNRRIGELLIMRCDG